MTGLPAHRFPFRFPILLTGRAGQFTTFDILTFSGGVTVCDMNNSLCTW